MILLPFVITLRPQLKNYGLFFSPNVNHLERLFSLFSFTSGTTWVPVAFFILFIACN